MVVPLIIGTGEKIYEIYSTRKLGKVAEHPLPELPFVWQTLLYYTPYS